MSQFESDSEEDINSQGDLEVLVERVEKRKEEERKRLGLNGQSVRVEGM